MLIKKYLLDLTYKQFCSEDKYLNKLLNDGYFNKGLTTIETIGKVYNPTYNSNGIKIAKPSWVKNVTNALDEYVNYDIFVDLSVLNSLKNVE